MRALLIGADQHNPTDGQIVRGTKYLLSKKYTNIEFDYVFIDDHKDMRPEDFNSSTSYDLLVVCGTPWIWDHFWNTAKYRNQLLARKTHPKAKVILMGIGTCMNISAIGSPLLTREKERSKLREMCEGVTVIVRDSIAKSLLDNAGVSSQHLPCPAFWTFVPEAPFSILPDCNLLVWYDPRFGVSNGDWTDKEKLKTYCRRFVNFHKKYPDCAVRCAKPEDVQGALELGLPKPEVFSGHEQAIAAIFQSNNVISGRVHNAVPAVRLAGNVELVAVDSRSQTFEDFKHYKDADFDAALESYMEILP